MGGGEKEGEKDAKDERIGWRSERHPRKEEGRRVVSE